MGKKQHQKDKLYLTSSEWKAIGGHKDDSTTRMLRANFKRLPFNHCALSFLPFTDPVCSLEGILFDIAHITPYIKRHGINPVTGKKMSAKDLVVLSFAKDAEGNFRCPVTYRIFTATSKIVAIRTTGNVYSWEAVEELNMKRNYLKDLITETPFLRSDIITLQDPNDIERWNIEKFHHVQFDQKTKAEIAEQKKVMESPMYFLNRVNNETKEALAQLDKQYKTKEAAGRSDETADTVNAAHYSQGKVSQSLTSTWMDPAVENKAAVLDEDTVKYARVTNNAYLTVMTSHGPLNFELYAKHAPKASENFLQHCSSGYYNGSKFYRSIKHFMLQGGDPTGTGKGGASIWGKPFADEISGTYKFDARGVLAMANRGSNTNQSQFFITYRPCSHLDGKHTIFGKLVGGAETLAAIERVETDDKDVPLQPIVFLSASVFQDPFEEAAAAVQKERLNAKEAKEKSLKDEAVESPATSAVVKPKAYSSGVGRYIKPELKSTLKRAAGDEEAPALKRKAAQSKPAFSDFSAW